MNKETIFELAFREESSEMCREYFKQLGLTLEKQFPKSYYEKLSEFIQEEIDILLADETYQMIKQLRMHNKIIYNKDGVELFTNGSYFDKREAITFVYAKERSKIYFCGWASGCNRIPYIKGFIKWCDWVKEQLK
jgi:hypothetical protein